MLKIYITNLGKYNEGELIGEWVDLPISDDELQEVLERIGINENYEEYFITDYENDFNYAVGEYDSIEELNEIAEQVDLLDDDEKTIVQALIDYGYSFVDALETYEDCIMYDCSDFTELAYLIVDECGYLDGVAEAVSRYFDYEAFGRDLSFDGYHQCNDCIIYIP